MTAQKAFHFRQYICALLVAALLCVQFLLAQHESVHLLGEGQSLAAIQVVAPAKSPALTGHDTCDLCDFAKMLGHTADMPLPQMLPPLMAGIALLLLFPAAFQTRILRPYAARASPVSR